METNRSENPAQSKPEMESLLTYSVALWLENKGFSRVLKRFLSAAEIQGEDWKAKALDLNEVFSKYQGTRPEEDQTSDGKDVHEDLNPHNKQGKNCFQAQDRSITHSRTTHSSLEMPQASQKSLNRKHNRARAPEKFRARLEICSPDSFSVTPVAVDGFTFPGEQLCFQKLRDCLSNVELSHYTKSTNGAKAFVFGLVEYQTVMWSLKNCKGGIECEDIPWRRPEYVPEKDLRETFVFSIENFDNWKFYMPLYFATMHYYMGRVIEYGPIKIMKEGCMVEKSKHEYTAEDIEIANLDNVAKNELFKILNETVFNKLRCKTAKDIWDKITMICEGTVQFREIKLDIAVEKFEKFKMKSGESIDEMDSRFTKLINELTSLKKEYSNREMALKVLGGLPREWDMKTTIMEEVKDLSKISLIELFSDLKAYELKLIYRRSRNEL